ncbi:hypothetical protein DAPPUDRAFT_249362 [Daphnia pulex]|uniref:Uncharacterized protein n=1 Tax=Daphnia pulex TaxID=6669 RepID=E9GWI5_DAPPU|nr:hypothetical protein DAPPUDRAFT_249362 [Daphnia pulex]|eukprot:EFX76182.1 hypothetical protein DAPPUDRAFT_249362 [Daphnia pulex]
MTKTPAASSTPCSAKLKYALQKRDASHAGIDYIQRYKKREGKGLEELTCVKQLRPTEESLPPPHSYAQLVVVD